MSTTPDPYSQVVELVEQLTGADIAAHLVGRVGPHVDRQVQQHGLGDARGYADALSSGELGEKLRDELLADLLVHETFFYRFAAQLEALDRQILPDLLQGRTAPLRVWSAGCSRGPEPYTLAMMADRAARRVGLGELSLEVLGTDICGAFLETARRGVYEEAKVAALPADLRSHYLEPESEGRLAVAPAIRRLVTLRRHGLLEPPPAKRFDLVSCRNVLIYLRPGARRRALEGLASVLVPNGVLLVGHSESLRDVPELFVPKRRLALGIYRLAREDDRREASPSLGSVASKPATTSLKPASRSTSPVTPLLTAPPPVVTSQPRRTELLRLEGEYDLDRSPETLERLKRRLSEAIEAGRDVLIDADGAICLDEPTAKLVIRAARAVEAHGLWLRVAATRPPVRRWAERHRLPLQVHEETPEVRRT